MFLRIAAACAASVALIAPANATIISGAVTGGQAQSQGGVFEKLTLPFDPPNGAINTVGNNTFQTPNLYGFDEDQNILLGADLSVDGGTISAGTVVASHYIFFDPNNSTTITGSVTFDSEILGVVSSTGLLAASDFLANTGVTYLNPGLRGLEANTDSYSLSDAFTIAIAWRASTPGDYIRVLTARSPGAPEVPIPGAIPLFLSGLAGFGFMKRRRKA